MLPGNLQRTSPEQQGIDSSAVLRFVEALERETNEVHSLMLLRHGSVIAEGWWSPYGRGYPHELFSLSKSFTSTAVGLAIAEGRFSLDNSVLSFFPEETPAEMNELWGAMRVRHLLSMSTGQTIDPWTRMVDRPDGNWSRGFFSVPVRNVPGSQFLYNTGATYMLSGIVQRTTGLKVVDYLQARLFAPLGIEGAAWQESPQGVSAGGIGLRLKTEDVARFGQLYLQNGFWEGNQLLPHAWVEEATSTRISNDDHGPADWSQGYGYQFWRCRYGAYRGDGVFGQFCIVMPEQDAVLTITSGVDVFDMQKQLELVWDILLPAMSANALPENTSSHAALSTKLTTLSLRPVQGQSTSPSAPRVSGRTYVVDANELGIETLSLKFGRSGCELIVNTAAGEEIIPCGYDEWHLGRKSALFTQSLSMEPTPVCTSGAWTSDDIFTMIVRLYETPFYQTAVWYFSGKDLMVALQINVSMESLRPVEVTGRAG